MSRDAIRGLQLQIFAALHRPYVGASCRLRRKDTQPHAYRGRALFPPRSRVVLAFFRLLRKRPPAMVARLLTRWRIIKANNCVAGHDVNQRGLTVTLMREMLPNKSVDSDRDCHGQRGRVLATTEPRIFTTAHGWRRGPQRFRMASPDTADFIEASKRWAASFCC
jgi:hypothetical protein